MGVKCVLCDDWLIDFGSCASLLFVEPSETHEVLVIKPERWLRAVNRVFDVGYSPTTEVPLAVTTGLFCHWATALMGRNRIGLRHF